MSTDVRGTEARLWLSCRAGVTASAFEFILIMPSDELPDPKSPDVASTLDISDGLLCTPSPHESNATRGVGASPTADEDRPGCRPDDASGKLTEEYVLALATEVCDHNIQLTSHVETLRARVLELEDDNARLRKRSEDTVAVGVEKMVELLQADIAGMQRELELLKVAKRAVDEDLEAERLKNGMLTEMLEAARS